MKKLLLLTLLLPTVAMAAVEPSGWAPTSLCVKFNLAKENAQIGNHMNMSWPGQPGVDADIPGSKYVCMHPYDWKGGVTFDLFAYMTRSQFRAQYFQCGRNLATADEIWSAPKKGWYFNVNWVNAVPVCQFDHVGAPL